VANGYDGYDVTINPSYDFESYLTVDVDAYCQDFYGNIAELLWDFRIEDYANPEITDNFPTGVGIARATNVTFITRDVGSTINPDSIRTTLNGNYAYTRWCISEMVILEVLYLMAMMVIM